MSGLPRAVPHAIAARKPPHGAPCNRCGLCCIVTLCDLGRHVFHRPRGGAGPCPALSFDADGSRCGLVDSGTVSGREAAKWLIGSGTGCDARINGEPVNQEFNARLERWDVENAEPVRLAKQKWGMR